MTVPSPRARYGDRRLSRQQRVKRLALLSAAVRASAEEAAELARELATALPRCSDEELVRAVASRTAADARGQLLVVLVDLDGRRPEDAAALLDLDPAVARPLLDRARTGDRPLGATCRGWGLASGRAGLTASELEAGREHLQLCRRCRERRTAVDAARRQLVARATGAAGLLGAAELALAGGAVTSTVGAVLGGKAVAGAVAGLGAAVLATGATVAAAQTTGFVPPPRDRAPAVRSTSAPTVEVAPSPVPPGSLPAPGATRSPQPGPLPVAPLLPTSLPTSLPDLTTGLDGVPLDLPTSLTTDLPTSLPLPLPTPLPTALPLPLPTELPLLPLLP